LRYYKKLKLKKVLFAVAFIFAATTSFAQDGDGAYQKGSSTISLGYGFLSPYKTLFSLTSLGSPNVVFSSLGPIGLTYEYGATDKISVGLQVAYGTLKNVTTTTNGLGANKDLIETDQLDQLSVIARVNYHFGSNAKFDPYGGLGLGYGNFKFSSTDNSSTPNASPNVFAIPGAFGITGQLGAKYYFSSSIGAYAEIGYLAGSFAQLGITAKF
jgi:outer membrane protein W